MATRYIRGFGTVLVAQSITAEMLSDVLTRAFTVIGNSEHADEHVDLLANLHAANGACEQAISQQHGIAFPRDGSFSGH